jgi:hypothetical protein
MNINILLNDWLNIINRIKQVDDYNIINMNDDESLIKVNFNFRNGLFSKEEYKNTEREIKDYLVNNSMFHKDFDTRSYLPMRVNEIEKKFIEIFGTGIKYIDKYSTIYFNHSTNEEEYIVYQGSRFIIQFKPDRFKQYLREKRLKELLYLININ